MPLTIISRDFLVLPIPSSSAKYPSKSRTCNSRSKHRLFLPSKPGKHHMRTRSTDFKLSFVNPKLLTPPTMNKYLDTDTIPDLHTSIFRPWSQLMDNTHALMPTYLSCLRRVWDCATVNTIQMLRLSFVTFCGQQGGLRPRHEFSITPISEWHTPECVLNPQNASASHPSVVTSAHFPPKKIGERRNVQPHQHISRPRLRRVKLLNPRRNRPRLVIHHSLIRLRNIEHLFRCRVSHLV